MPPTTDHGRVHALSAALDIARLNNEHLATAEEVVKDAKTIYAFLVPSSAYSSDA